MHPILFQTKYFILHTFWLLIALGIIIGVYTLIKLGLRNSLKLQFLSQHSWKLILWSLIFARIFSLIKNYYIYFSGFNFQKIFNLFYFWDKNLSGWGAIFGLTITFYYLCKKYEQNFWKWLDILIPALLITIAFTHLGAFFEGINYGHETNLPWKINFESPAVKYAVPIHPTQIYAFIYSILLTTFLIIFPYYKNFKKEGTIGIIGIITYSGFRFLEGFIRGDDVAMIFNIRIPQIFAFLILIISSIFLYFHIKEKTRFIYEQVISFISKKFNHFKK